MNHFFLLYFIHGFTTVHITMELNYLFSRLPSLLENVNDFVFSKNLNVFNSLCAFWVKTKKVAY